MIPSSPPQIPFGQGLAIEFSPTAPPPPAIFQPSGSTARRETLHEIKNPHSAHGAMKTDRMLEKSMQLGFAPTVGEEERRALFRRERVLRPHLFQLPSPPPINAPLDHCCRQINCPMTKRALGA